MLALFRIILNLKEREHFLRTRYHSRHPHFLLYLLLDAILSFSLVGGGYALASSQGIFTRDTHAAAELGAIPLTLGQVRADLKDHDIALFWIGPISGAKYLTEITAPEAVSLHYLIPGAESSLVNFKFLTIKTFSDQLRYNNSAKEPLHSSPNLVKTNVRGDTVTYNPNNLRQIVVALAGSSKVVVIIYAVPQTLKFLLKDSEQLVELL